jgi:DegV family protein with EDD domain
LEKKEEYMKRKVMCTSSGCIEEAPERYQNLGIVILRHHIYFEGEHLTEGDNLDIPSFYARMETIKDPKNNLPKTSFPSVEEIKGYYKIALDEGCEEALVFAISSGLSGTYSALCQVAKEFEAEHPEMKIYVIDTKTNSFGEGFQAIRAQQLVNEGVPTEQILKEITWMQKDQQLIGVDGKLDYLIYNGRLKGGKAFFGKMLSICPVVHFNRDGECVALESVRTPKKALARMCEILKERIGDRDPKDYLLWHVFTGPSLLEKLVEIEKEYGVVCNHEDVIMSAGSGCHNGPWLAGYGLVFLRREDEPLE